MGDITVMIKLRLYLKIVVVVSFLWGGVFK